MPDALTTIRRDEHLTAAELIRRERRPLPAHDLDGVNYRAWAAAVCAAEIDHRKADFWRAALHLGVRIDRYAEPDADVMGQFDHERHAAAALSWLSHLLAHEADRRGPWAAVRWNTWDAERRQEWFIARRHLWAGFVRQVERYREARRQISAPATAREAA